jgi:hypothetical protein
MQRRTQQRGKRPDRSLTLSVEAMEPRRVCAAGLSVTLVRDTGRSANDRVTSDAMLVISRPLAAGQRVEYRVNGYNFQTAVMADASRFVPEGIGADGTYRVAARLVDASGRATPVGPTLTFRLDRSAAPLQVALRQDSGVSATDRITTNGSLVVSGQERNATLQYSRDTGSWDPATAAWGGYAPQPGLNRWRVRQVDVAGNASTPVAIDFQLDAARDERVTRVEGPPSGPFVAAEGQRIAWVLEFERPMYVSSVAGTVPGIQFTFRGQELMARFSGGSGTNRLEYSYVFTAEQAGAGTLVAPTHACLCFGGLITDAAGNKLRKHELPAVAAAVPSLMVNGLAR